MFLLGVSPPSPRHLLGTLKSKGNIQHTGKDQIDRKTCQIGPTPIPFVLGPQEAAQDIHLISYLVIFSSYSLRTLKKYNKNNSNNAGSGQVRSPERVWQPQLSKVCKHVRARVFHGAISSLQIFITVPVCVICLSKNFYVCDLRSGQSRYLYITSLWENNEVCPDRVYES